MSVLEAVEVEAVPLRHEPVQKRAVTTIEELEAAAREALRRHGRDRLTTAHVADLSGYSIGTVYRYFPDRVAILDRIWPDRDAHLPAGFVPGGHAVTLVENTRLSALQALQLRAGASDKDREAWLAQRRLGITGTEIRDLHLGAKRAADLIADKLGRSTSSFAGNMYTRWGNEREPVIAELVQWRYGISPESRLFRAVDNPRFLVSPDGLGEGFDGELLGSEIKTAGMDVSTTSEAFKKKGYLYQVVWAMVVTGARRWLYAWEKRDADLEGGFEPGELQFEWIVWDDSVADIAAELMDEAEAILEQLDAAAAEAYVAPDVDDTIDTHAVNYLRFIADEKAAGEAKKAEYEAILAVVGEREDFKQEGATARVTLTPMKLGTRPETDGAAAQAARPDLWKAVTDAESAWQDHLKSFTTEVQTETKPRLTITAVNPTKEKS